MKKYVVLFILFAAVGCENLEENAPSNYKKGEEFLRKGEYEIAEYYFDKVPEDSPWYKRTQKRLTEVHRQQDAQAVRAVSSSIKNDVSVIQQSFQVNNFGKVPFHFVTLENATDKTVQMVELEFVYFDSGGREVGRLPSVLNIDIPPNSTKELKNISPGVVNDKFERVSVNILRVLFQ